MRKIVLVGNTNVGKSTLFNLICKKDLSIVYNQDNTTLDYVSTYLHTATETMKLTDTAGVNNFQEWMTLYGKVLLEADLILYVCDVSKPIDNAIEVLYRKLYALKKEIWIIAHKSDKRPSEEFRPEKLNNARLICTAVNNLASISHLRKELGLDEVADSNNEAQNIVAIVGRANAGKSTLMNWILNEQRVAVSSTPGTTVDHVYETSIIEDVPITFVDTPGFTHSNIHGVQQADFTYLINKRRTALLRNRFVGQIVLIDGELGVTRQDKQVIDQAINIGLFTIVCVNKCDVISKAALETMKYVNIPDNISKFHISAKTGKGVSQMLKQLSNSISNFYGMRIATPKLNKCLELIKSQPSVSAAIRSIKYMTQTKQQPITISYFSSHALSVHDMKCLKRHISKYFDLTNYRLFLQRKLNN